MSRTQSGLFVIVGLALVVRLLFAGLVVGFDRAPIGDEIDYHHIAANLAAGDGYALVSGTATARRPPLYPILLSLVYKIVGPSPPVGRVLQALFGAAIVWLVFVVAHRYGSSRAAWWATAATAVNPFLIFISGYMLTENLYIILLLVFLLVIPRPASIVSPQTALVAGLLLALAVLARPTGFTLAEWVLGAYLLFGVGSIPQRLARGGLLAAVVLVMLIPWTVRNYRTLGRPIVFTSHGGITFYQGNNPRVLEIPQYRGSVAPLDQLPEHERLSRMTQLERDDAAWALGKQFLRENKSKVPILVWSKFRRFWRFRSESGLSGIKSGWWFGNRSGLGKLATTFDAGFLYAVFAIPFFVLGLVITWRRWRELLFVYGIIASHTAISLVFHGSLRMRSPLEPIIAIVAAEAVVRTIDRARGRRRSLTDDPHPA